MKILVTGTAGFIGLQLAKALSDAGHEVLGVDKRENTSSQWLETRVADLANWDQVKDLGKFDAIYHMAGHSAGDLSIEFYEEDIKDNLLSTAHIIKLAKETGASQIIHASSMAVYGDQPKYPVSEGAEPMPRVYYGANKLAAEYYLKISNDESLDTTSIRLFNIYGPGQDVNNLTQGMVSIFVGELIINKHFEMRGSPDRYRDFLYIDDTVEGLVQCLGNKKIKGEVINMGSGVTHTLGQLLDKIRERLPFETTVSYTNPTSFDLNRMHADISKARELLGFNPKFTLDAGLDRMIEWVLSGNDLAINHTNDATK